MLSAFGAVGLRVGGVGVSTPVRNVRAMLAHSLTTLDMVAYTDSAAAESGGEAEKKELGKWHSR